MQKSLIFFLGLLPFIIKGQVFTDSDLPIVVITTEFNQPIPDDPRIIANMGIIYNGPGNRNYMTDAFNNYDGRISIEIRGSTSQQYPKKSYALETQDITGNNFDATLLGMPFENDWILYAPYPDKTMIRNVLTYYMFRKMGRWAARTRYCELVVNNQYRGVYVLMEKVKRDVNRVNIASLTPMDTISDGLTGGYLMKIDKTTGTGQDSISSAYSSKVYFLYHDPLDDELVQVQKDYISNHIGNFEDALAGPNFTDPVIGWRAYLDQFSFIDFFLLQELGRTVDGYRSSSFFYKDKNSRNKLIKAGPMWDFNLSYGNANYCDSYMTNGWQYNFNTICTTFNPEVPFWWDRLLQDAGYRWQLKCRWQYLRQSFMHTDSLLAFVDSVAIVLDESQQRNFQKWPILGQYVNWNYFVGNTYQEEIDYLKGWLQNRTAWMDNNLPGTCIEGTDDMEDTHWISIFPNPSDGFFNISGMEGTSRIIVTDITGRIIHIQDVNTTQCQIDIAHSRKGIYFIKIFTLNQLVVKKVILH